MLRRFRWRPTKKQVFWAVGIAVVLLVIYSLAQIDFSCNWTGFGRCSDLNVVKELRPAKTLWDWLGLLLVPLVLAGGGLWFSRQEKRYELQIAEQRSQEAALQAYLDQMTALLLDKGLRTSEKESEVQAVARSRTLTVLRRLDGERKASVVQFLYESDLINKYEPIVALQKADLRGADLRRADLRGADLRRADLRGASLQGAFLQEASLQRTFLQRANLQGAFLQGADLQGVFMSDARLRDANLRDANLRDARLQEANLQGVNLQGAFLQEANLQGAFLQGAFLQEANLQGSYYNSRTRWPADVPNLQARGASLIDGVLE